MTKLEEIETKLNELDTQIQELKEQEFEPFWEPTIDGDDKYYFISESGTISFSKIIDDSMLMGNYYKTKELAQKALGYQQAEQMLRKAVWDLNKGVAPKFKEDNINNTLRMLDGELIVSHFVSGQINPDWLYLNTKELVEQLIESHSEDLITYLHGI